MGIQARELRHCVFSKRKKNILRDEWGRFFLKTSTKAQVRTMLIALMPGVQDTATMPLVKEPAGAAAGAQFADLRAAGSKPAAAANPVKKLREVSMFLMCL